MQQAAELLASAKQECFETHQLWQDASNWGDSHSEVEAALKARLDINAETQADLENFIWLATNRALGIDDPRPEQIELAFKLAGRSPEKKGFCKCVGNGAGPSGVLERTIDLRDADVDWSTPSSSFLADEVEPRGESTWSGC